MVKRIENISAFKQKEWLRAEHCAYAALDAAGYAPQGYDFRTKDYLVFKIQNEHRNNERREAYHFKDWQSAAKELCGYDYNAIQ